MSISVSRPPSATRRDDILPIEPSVGSDSGMEDVKPSLRDLLQSAATSKIATPPRKQHDAVAEPSKTLSPRQSTVSIAPSTASGTTASLTFTAAAGEASVRTIARESPAPPSTSSGQDDFAPVWSSQKPPDGNGKRKAEGTLSSAHPTKAKSSRLNTGPGDGGTSEVASDVDELEDQDETERPPDETQRSRNLPPTIESRFMHRRRTANGKTSFKAAAMKAQSTSKPVTTKAQAASNAAQTSPQSAARLAPALESAQSSAMNLHQANQLPPAVQTSVARLGAGPPSASSPQPALRPPSPPPSVLQPQLSTLSSTNERLSVPLTKGSSSLGAVNAAAPNALASSLMASIGRAAAKHKYTAAAGSLPAGQHPPQILPSSAVTTLDRSMTSDKGPSFPTTDVELQETGALRSCGTAAQVRVSTHEKSLLPTPNQSSGSVTAPSRIEAPEPSAATSASAPLSQSETVGHKPVVVELGDSDSDPAPAVVRVKLSTEYGKILDGCEREQLEPAAIAERLQAMARASKSTRTCIDFVLDRKHPMLRKGNSAVNVLVRLTTKDDQHPPAIASQSTSSSSIPADQAKRDKVFRQTCRRDILQGIVSADERKYADRLPVLRAYLEFPTHHEGTIERHLREHFRRIRTRRPRTAIHYQSLGWLLQPAEFYRDVNGRLILDGLVELHDAERDATCIQILAGLIQQFCP